MKLSALRFGTLDGAVLVVVRDLKRALKAGDMAPPQA